MKNLIILIASILFTSTACKEENVESREGRLKVNVELYNGPERVMIDDTVKMQDYNFYLSLFRLYLAEIEITNAAGTREISSIELVDPASTNANSFSAKVREGDYTSFALGFGVDPVQNDMDPGSFPNEHPLSSYQSMYWSMLKYRFAKFEGFADSSATPINENYGIAYHPGTNPLYRKKSYDLDIKVRDGQTTEILMAMDINDIMDGPGGKIDFANEPQTHSEPSDIQIAIKFMDNIAAAAKVSRSN
jgi:hypothetical protein